MEIGGYNNVPDWPKMGPSLLIATCLIVAIRTAKWSATHDAATSDIELDVAGSFTYNGAWNFNISGQNLNAAQFNTISQQGRYGLAGSHFGIGPTLHVPSSFHWDPNHVFASSNIGGQLSVLFPAHIDSANGNLFPTGTLFHLF